MLFPSLTGIKLFYVQNSCMRILCKTAVEWSRVTVNDLKLDGNFSLELEVQLSFCTSSGNFLRQKNYRGYAN